MSKGCEIFKLVILVLICLLVFFSYKSAVTIDRNYQEVKRISETLNTLINLPINETETPSN